MAYSKKTEDKAITFVRTHLDEIDDFRYQVNSSDSEFTWDGYIDIFEGNVDKKSNFKDRINIQVKGRKVNRKRFEDKTQFDIDVADLENFKKVDGSIFLLVLINQENDMKLYYSSLLTNNINKYLVAVNESTNKVRIKLKEIKNSEHLKNICLNFKIDKDVQKKLPESSFNQFNLTQGKSYTARFQHIFRNNQTTFDLIGEEKNFYILDDNENIIGVETIDISGVEFTINKQIEINNIVEYENYTIGLTENIPFIIFGNSFVLDFKEKLFKIHIKGNLLERIKDLKFINKLKDCNKIEVNEVSVNISLTPEAYDKYNKMLIALEKIKEFCENYNINYNLELNNWENKDFADLFKWIDSIENNHPLHVKEWEYDGIGSIKIKDLEFCISATKKEKNSDLFYIKSLWDKSLLNGMKFKYVYGEKNIFTSNLYSVLLPEIYMAKDFNLNFLKDVFNDYVLDTDEEELLNLQALSAINAYDKTNNNDLLDYAEFLLDKIEKYEDIYNIVQINKYQIKKRKNNLTEEDISNIIKIRNSTDDKMQIISCNILINNLLEVKQDLFKLTEIELEYYKSFPIYNLYDK